MSGGLEVIPAWLGTAVIGAVVATLGYVAKLLLETITDLRAAQRRRRAQLVELLSILRASQAAFLVQSEVRDRLAATLLERKPELRDLPRGYDRMFTAAFPELTTEERELHTIVRSITVYTLRSLNAATLDWLRGDDYFKAARSGAPLERRVAKRLAALYAHLLLWRAKFEVWMTDPAHALVYLDDEEQHGVGFPHGIEGDVEALLDAGTWWAWSPDARRPKPDA